MASLDIEQHEELRFLLRATGSRFIEAKRNGALVLHRKPKAQHPADNYLEVCLAWYHGKFVVWATCNLQSGGCDAGSYYTQQESGSLEQAYIDALKKFDATGMATQLHPIAQYRIHGPRAEAG